MAHPAGTRSGRMTADERRDAIVVAALDEFATHGLAGASSDVIARAAGVSQPYVFQLFGTKRDLFLAVVHHAFWRVRLAFEDAERRFSAGEAPGCGTILASLGVAYMDMLADRTLLMIQLQAYAASSDPEIRRAVRAEFGALYAFVRQLSGERPDVVHRFFEQGMLLNVGAAMDLDGPPATWSLEQFGGDV